MKRRRPVLLLLLASLGLLVHAGPAAPQTGEALITVQDVSLDRQEGTTAVRISTSGRVRYEASLLDRPPRLVIDLAETTLGWRRGPMKAGSDPVTEVRASQQRPRTSRIVIELTGKSDYHIESSESGLRVVFQSAAPAPKTAEAPSAAPAPAASPPTGSAVRPAPPPPQRVILSGIVSTDRGEVAYIQDPSTGNVGRYRVGDSIGDATIEAIAPDHVVLRGPAGRQELWLGDARPATRPAAAPPPPSLSTPPPPPPPPPPRPAPRQ